MTQITVKCFFLSICKDKARFYLKKVGPEKIEANATASEKG